MKKFGKSAGLRTLDALQIASFALFSERDWIMVASDMAICSVVKKLGFKTNCPL